MSSQRSFTENFRVEHVHSSPNAITIRILMKNIELSSSSNIILNIYKQKHNYDKENYEKLGNVYLKYPFKEHYTLEDLTPLTTYKINFFLTAKQNTYHVSFFGNTTNDPNKSKVFKKTEERNENPQKSKKVFSKTEDLLYKYTEAKSTNLPIYTGQKDLKKNILDARSAKQWKDYQSSGYKFARPKENFETRKKRVWLVANGFEIFDQVQSLVDKGKGFNPMEGDWFMGPFYSYDYNVAVNKAS